MKSQGDSSEFGTSYRHPGRPLRPVRRRRRARRPRGAYEGHVRRPSIYSTAAPIDDPYDWSYASLATHRLMLHDDMRNQAYRQALLATVKPGDVVLDFGAGTGILSLFAAQAGAARVYAVERTAIARLARRLVKRNGFDDRIVVIRGDVEHVNLPENVDVIVSEWLGAFGVDENMLAPLVVARDRWLKPGGRMLPETVTAWVAPLWNDALDREMTLQSGRPYDLDLSLVADAEAEEVSWTWLTVPEETLAAEPQTMWTTDVREVSRSDAKAPFTTSLILMAARDCRINALTTWFSATFGDDITLTNAPTAPETHWGQYLFPLRKAVAVPEGTPIRVEFACIPAGPGYCAYTWSVRVGDKPWEHHDTRLT
jgi:type I protein arginine methyltransferase